MRRFSEIAAAGMCFVFLAIIIAQVSGCPDPQTGKVNPYLTARTIIMGSQTGLSVADGIFGQWYLMQSDKEKAVQTQATYYKIKTAVANGFQLALNGVDIAEQAKKDPDVNKLLAEANEAWGNLHKFLSDLLGPVPGSSASQPTTKTGIGSSTHALSKPDPYKDLKAQFAKLKKTLR